jgi:hypothetical protein
MEEERKEITVDDYRKALADVQGELQECVGDLIILRGYFEGGDPNLHPEYTGHIFLSTRELVANAAEKVVNALNHTYPAL